MTLHTPSLRFKFALFFIAASACLASAEAAKPSKNKVSAKTAQSQGALYATREDAMQFADDLASRRNLDPAWVRQAIGQSRFNPTVARLMQPPTKSFVKNWRV
ncbi:MAG: lytic murein transglycosylase B, partial [Polaromonas sp.]